MSSRSPIVPAIAPRRVLALPASFTASGGLLALLLVVLVGCSSFGTNVNPADKVEPPVRNAILCNCECDGIVVGAAPSANSIRVGADDATQTPAEATAVLAEKTEAQRAAREQLLARQAALSAAREDKQGMLAGVREERHEDEEDLEQMQAASAAISAQIQAAAASAPPSSGGGNPSAAGFI